MESKQTEAIAQTELFSESNYSQLTPSPSNNNISGNKQHRRVNHMPKFKPFHEFQKPLVGISHEAFLDYIETVIPADHLCRLVKEVAADSGYGSNANYEYLEQKGIDGYVPDNNFQQYKNGEYEKEANRYHYSNFKYDESTDSYTCPEGKPLKYWKTRKNKTRKRQWNHKVYRGRECRECTKRSLCTKSKVRELLIDIREPLLRKMREKLSSEEGKRKYFKRQYTIEPIFGHLKFNLGYRNFLLRVNGPR